MKKFTLSLFFLFAVIYCYSQDESISWGQKKIILADFKGTPPPKQTEKASIDCQPDYKIQFVRNDSIVIEVKNLFYPKNSWTLAKTEEVLNHETRHFDISEIYARKIRKKLSEMHFKKTSAEKEVAAVFKKLEGEMSKYEEKYDKETKHSEDKEKQLIWDKQIEKELLELKDYSSTHVPLNTKKKISLSVGM